MSRSLAIETFPDPPRPGEPFVVAVHGLYPGERVTIQVAPGGASTDARAAVDGIARGTLVVTDLGGAAGWRITVAAGGDTLAMRTFPGVGAGVAPSRPATARSATPAPPPPSRQTAAARTPNPPLPPGIRAAFEGVPAISGQWHPDHALAVGPTTVALVGNGVVAIREKDGTLLASLLVTEFFDPVRLPGEGVGDPWMTFDPQSQRFFYVADGTVGNGHSTSCLPGDCKAHQLLAVSRDANPRTLSSNDWYFYALDRTVIRSASAVVQTATWGDFDNIVVDEDSVLIKWPAYAFGVASGAPGQDQGVRIRVVRKATLISGEPVTSWTDLQLRDPQTGALWTAPTEPAIGSGKPGPFFLVGTRGCGFVIWAVQGLLPDAALVSREVPSIAPCSGISGGAVQPAAAARIDIQHYGHNLVYRDGSLWYAYVVGHDFGSGQVSAIRWVQIDVSSWPAAPRIVQDGVFGQDAVWELAPALILDAGGNTVLVFGRSSTTEFPSLYYTYRTPIDSPGSLRPAQRLRGGEATWTAFSAATGNRNRYVDFFAAALDPADGSVWLFGAYVGASGERATWVANTSLVNR